jgi:hypothetical protein
MMPPLHPSFVFIELLESPLEVGAGIGAVLVRGRTSDQR